MKRGFQQIIWVVVVVALSAIMLSKLEQWERQRIPDDTSVVQKTALVFLVGYAGEEFPGSENSESYQKVGCDDALIRYEIPVITMRLASVLNALSAFEPPEGLHNPMKDKGVGISGVEERPRGTVVVDLRGELQLGGLCDSQRLRGQIEETIGLYVENAEIHLNGSVDEFTCMADVYGKCT